MASVAVWFLGPEKYLVGRTNEWGTNLLGLRQTSALKIKTRYNLADPFCYMQEAEVR